MKTSLIGNLREGGYIEFEHLNIEVDRYTVRKLISPEIEIAEINDNGYNGYDFVLIKYVNKKNVCEQVQLLALKYKQSEKTLCLIGCEKEDIECKCSSKTNVVHKNCSNLFDLSFSSFSDQQYELLIDICLATGIGIVSMYPEEWFSDCDKRIGNSFALVSAFSNTYSQSMSDVLKQISMEKNISNIIVAFISSINTPSFAEKSISSEIGDLMVQIGDHMADDCDFYLLLVDNTIGNYTTGVALIYQIKNNS
ncbi:hypothetical protein [Treponema vincentii]|uniref:hypothetical protein n=1 Tax=Treponema vincentii TaxID=69710 RepID=UPI000570E4CD|nr:hypothetical protein [Treponema vincentii]